MESLLCTASSRILLNGRQGPPIKHLRGVRQGDSLSPMLFIIAMDVLHRLFIKASHDGVFRKLEPSEVRYQCSMHADDVILFIRPTVQEARAVKRILTIFGEASGLKTNLSKCSITPIYGVEDNIDSIVSILGCQVQPFPLKYLGLPLSTNDPKGTFLGGSRIRRPKAATLSWLAHGQEWLPGLGEISASCSANLHDDGQRLANLGTQ